MIDEPAFRIFIGLVILLFINRLLISVYIMKKLSISFSEYWNLTNKFFWKYGFLKTITQTGIEKEDEVISYSRALYIPYNSSDSKSLRIIAVTANLILLTPILIVFGMMVIGLVK